MQIKEKFENRLSKFGAKSNEISKKISELEKPLQELMEYLYGTMPLSDVANYEFEVFLSYAKHGIILLETTKVPKDIFLNYVLYHRINNESIEDCRSFFHDEVVKEMGEIVPSEEKILAINYFCASHVTYRASDDRTAAPKVIYQKGHGRCGEQSTLVCSIYRSVGLPARQVYSKRWSHCDDNHAWVEIYLDGKWYFLGACEPEEVLNKGWFLVASSRSMLIHHRTFGIEKNSRNWIQKEGNSSIYNELKTYAPTVDLQVTVQDQEGNLLDCTVNFGILNYSEICNIAQIKTKNGRCNLETGLGALFISIYQENSMIEEVIDTNNCNEIVLVLSQHTVEEKWKSFLFTAPKDSKVNKGYLTEEQKAIGKLHFSQVSKQRLARKYIAPQSNNMLVTKTLLEKDLYDTTLEVLIEHEQVENTLQVSDEIYQKFVLCPRVYYENITAYKRYINQYFSEEIKNDFRNNPISVITYIKEEIGFLAEEEYEELYTTPKALLELKSGNEISKKILFVAILRSLGIPARLNQIDLSLEYYENDKFVSVDKKEYGIATLLEEGNVKWEYYKNITISRYENNEYQTINLTTTPLTNTEILLPIGDYKIFTSNRIPNGNILGETLEFQVKKDITTTIKLSLQQATKQDMYHINQLEEFNLCDEEDNNRLASDIFNTRTSLLLWLEPAKEPTEHILNELFEQKEMFLAKNIKIYFILPNLQAKKDININKLLHSLQGIEVFCDKEGEHIEPIGRRMNVDHERLPLILLMKENLVGIFATSGYNVGTAEMLLKLM